MSAPYRLYGGAQSPYSRKVEACLRYKGLPYEWLERTPERAAEFAALAKLPLLPLLVGADGSALQDSTPILEALEDRHPEPAAAPEAPVLAFVSALVEDFADEWLNKALYHYRWGFEADARAASEAIALAALPEATAEQREAAAQQIREKMAERGALVGVTGETAAVIEASFQRTLAALEHALQGRPFLFGGRPAAADFALYGQLGQMLGDPAAGARLSAEAPRLAAYLARMAAPGTEGDFLPAEAALAPLEALLREIAEVYLPWLAANGQAQAANRDRFELELAGLAFAQAPQRYAARAFQDLRRRRAGMEDASLTALLERLGLEALLRLPAREPRRPAEPEADSDAPDAAEPEGAEAEGGAVEHEAAEGEPVVAAADIPPEDETLAREADA